MSSLFARFINPDHPSIKISTSGVTSLRIAPLRVCNSVLLLAAGQVMFHGPVQKVPTWLSDVGFPCPAAYNPADWLLDVVADDGELDEALLADTTR